MDIISIAQQARPNPSGQIELLRAQFTALSSVVKIMPSSSRSFPKSSGLVSVTCFPSDVLMSASSLLFSHRERVETNVSGKACTAEADTSYRQANSAEGNHGASR